jgi:thioredoxin-dependent peroxiredoxin
MALKNVVWSCSFFHANLVIVALPKLNWRNPMLGVGASVPNFELEDESGNQHSSAGLRGSRYVLYFYPKDDTPGCTKEACGFRDNLPKFDSLATKIFGVSADDVKAHRKFVAKFSLTFPLLADTQRTLIESMGVWVEKSMYGKKYMGIARATFVVNAQGTIEKVWEKVSPETHAEEVRAYLAADATAPAATKKLPDAPAKAMLVANTTAKKTPAAKPAQAKKTAVKKLAVKKPEAKKPGPKKIVATKAVAKRTAVKKAVAKKPATTKKVAAKKPALKKSTAKAQTAKRKRF